MHPLPHYCLNYQCGILIIMIIMTILLLMITISIKTSLLVWSVLTSSVSGWGFQRPSMARIVLVRNMTHLRVANFFQLNSKFCYLSKWKSLHFFTLTSTLTQESNPFGFLVTSHPVKTHFASALDFFSPLSFTQLWAAFSRHFSHLVIFFLSDVPPVHTVLPSPPGGLIMIVWRLQNNNSF